MNKKNMKKIVFTIIAVVVVAHLFMRANTYAFTESSAIALLDKNNRGKIVYSKQFGDIHLLIKQENNRKYLLEIERKWVFLYKVIDKVELSPSGTDKMKRTWSSRSQSNMTYETIIAAEIFDPLVKKVIVSNDDMLYENLNDAKKASTFFEELEVDNGYVVHYTIMDIKDATSFIFRLLNESGNIIFTGR